VKVVIFGATGMVGQGVLRECLLDPDVESVLAVVRNASLPQHDKLREIIHQDVSDLAAIMVWRGLRFDETPLSLIENAFPELRDND